MKDIINIRDIPVRDCDIPDSLQININNAFNKIRKEQVSVSKHYANRKYYSKRTAAIIAVVCFLLISTVIVYAATSHFWSIGSQSLIEADESQQLLLESRDRVDFLNEQDKLSVTVNNVTIKPMELIVDKYNARVTFIVIGTDQLTSCSSFYFDSFIPYLDDQEVGSSLGYIDKRMIDQNGIEGLGLAVCLDDQARAGTTIEGKTYKLEFNDLYYVSQTGVKNIIEGKWELIIPMPRKIDMLSYDLNQNLPGGRFSLASVELSELSVKTDFSFFDDQHYDTDLVDIPRISAIKLLDGRVLEYDTLIPNDDGKLRHELESGPPAIIYNNGLPYVPLEEIGKVEPIGGFSTATFNAVVDPYEIVEITLVTGDENPQYYKIPLQ